MSACEGEYLGWAAVAALAARRQATLGRAPLKRAIDSRLAAAARRCAALAPAPAPVTSDTSVVLAASATPDVAASGPAVAVAADGSAAVALLRAAAVSDGLEIVTGRR